MYAGNAVPPPYFADASFVSTLDYVASLGKRVQIVEFNYPAAPAGILHPPSPSYPLTPTGQAGFIADFAAAVRGKVDAIFYWYPDWHPGMDVGNPELESSGLFNAAGVGRPALEAFNTIAEERLLV
jgi:hypothetical protein